MSYAKEGAAPGKHHNDGPPRLNSSRCGNNHTSAIALNQSSSNTSPKKIKNQGENSMSEIAKREEEFSLIEQVVMQGDLSKLNPEQRVLYYRRVCESSGLNPYTNPFAYISLNGKLTLYAKKDCTEQLRKINGVSIEELSDKLIDDIYIVTAKAKDKHGRIDQAKGAVVVGNLRGEAKANAIMKAETKAKRRVTLSICGMGWTDESEIDSIPNAQPVEVNPSTGEIIEAKAQKVDAPAPQPQAEPKPKLKINQNEIYELNMILDDADPLYKKWFLENVKKNFGTNDLSGINADVYDRLKSYAVENMEQYRAKQRGDINSELISAEA